MNANQMISGPGDIFPRELIRQFSSRSLRTDLHSLLLIVHCWGTIIGCWVICTLWPQAWLVLPAMLVVGSRQLGLGVLGHDAAHYLLFRDRRVNDWVAEWLCNRPLLGASIEAYRRNHLRHHRFTQQPVDPDLYLSKPFPVTRWSLMRKLFRDVSGMTGWKQRIGFIRYHFRDRDGKLTVMRGVRRFGPNLAINGAFIAGFAWFSSLWLYLLLWVVPYLTWELLVERIRNIAEHAALPDDHDRLRNTRTTRAGWLGRALFAPYYVNYHLEHHLLVSVPCFRLPAVHQWLNHAGFKTRMSYERSYLGVLYQATRMTPDVAEGAS